MPNELKPCPFCGGVAQLTHKSECWGHGMNIDEHFVKCTQCGCKGKTHPAYDKTTAQCITDAIVSWNKRC